MSEQIEYELTVYRRVPNPDFDVQMKAWEERNRYGHFNPDNPAPSRDMEERSLSVTVTAETFAAIRKAALETL